MSPATANSSSSRGGKETAAFLRRIAMANFVPAFPLLLAHGLAANEALPAVGLVPLAGSVLLGGFVLYRDRVAAIGSPIRSLSPSNVFFADVLLSLVYIGLLIGSWVTLGEESWGRRSLIILGTYGTVFMMVNFGIHVYFVGLQVLRMVRASSCDCAHCQSVARRGRSTGMPSEYAPLSEDDAEEEDAYADVESGNGTVAL
ncbi:putative nucleosome binding protein [Neofusicoccum parvum]|uniref:Nucleosome binding protein n=1 Tax=Neofusicoccum parvum TaxID=310453 RepID=A0ACB5RYN5_9PEZI|nr:putative nucleosome binding protein [Neofusicoccum parvum]